MKTEWSVSLSFEGSIDLDMCWWEITEQKIRIELGLEESKPLTDEDVKFYIRHYLDPENILENASIQKSMVTHVEVTE